MSKLAWRMAWVTSAFAVVVACGSQAVEFPASSGGPGAGVACAKSNQCPANEGCVNGVCGACVDAVNCMPGQSCSAGQCGSCTANAQCPAGQACVNGACGGCTTSDQCADGKACVLGACSACTSNAQCLQGKVCVDGKCSCSTNDQCPGGQECLAGVCTAPSGGCATSDQCTGGTACINGACGPCTSNAQCLEGKICVDGKCSCTTSSQCPSVQECTGGVCKTSLDSGTDAADGGPLVDAADAADACTGKPVYQTLFPNVTSMWSFGGKGGTAAGNEMCKTIGSDHFCDYAEIRLAQSRGELAALPNMTFWVHRTTSEVVGGVANSGGTGARCSDWTYSTNHVNNGEFGTIAGGAITYDLAPAAMTLPGVSGSAGTNRLCGGVGRNILCCHPRCP